MAESTHPTLDTERTRFQLRRNTWLQSQARSVERGENTANVPPSPDPDLNRRLDPTRAISPDWPNDAFGPSVLMGDDLPTGGSASQTPDGADPPEASGRGHTRTPSPSLHLSRYKTQAKRKLSDHSQGSAKSMSERSQPASKNPITELISSSLPSVQERGKMIELTEKAEERQSFMAKQVVESMSGMSRLTELWAKTLEPAHEGLSEDLAYYELQARKLQLQHQEFDLEGKKIAQESARHERELRLKEQALSLEERQITLAERQAALGQDAIMKRANEYASMVARFISSGVTPEVAKELADDTLRRISEGQSIYSKFPSNQSQIQISHIKH